MKPYPSYKPSGVPWLGEVPAHWKKMRTANAFNSGSGTTPPTDEPEWYGGMVPWVQTSELRESVVLETEKNLTEAAIAKFSALRVHKKGSVVVAMYGATIGRVGVLGVDAAVNQACCVLSPVSNVASRFMFWWLQSMRPVLALMGTGGGQPNISQDKIAQLRFFSPTVVEQEAITAYLDRETARIDMLLAEKGRLIETLREYRQATISEVVTQGLDATVSKKPSGVPWMEDVPTHWDVVPIRYLSQGVKTGGTPPQDAFTDYPTEKDIPWYAPADLNKAFLTTSSRVVSIDSISEIDVFESGTIAMVGIGDVGRVSILTTRATGNQQINFIRPVESVLANFLTYALLAAQGFVQSRANVTLIPILNQEATKQLRMPSPPLKEQQFIAAYLDRETARIDKLVDHVQDEIKLLQELRAATITDAVTGKIQVS